MMTQPENRDLQVELLERLGRLRPGSEEFVLVVEDEMAVLTDTDLQALLNQVALTARRPMSDTELDQFDLAAELHAAWAAQQPLRDSIAANARTGTPATTWELLAPKRAPGA